MSDSCIAVFDGNNFVVRIQKSIFTDQPNDFSKDIYEYSAIPITGTNSVYHTYKLELRINLQVMNELNQDFYSEYETNFVFQHEELIKEIDSSDPNDEQSIGVIDPILLDAIT